MSDEWGITSHLPTLHSTWHFSLPTLHLSRGLFDFRDELAERRRVLHGEIGQLLAVEGDAGCLQPRDERAVGDPVLAGGGVDTHDPQAPEVPLLVAAADESILERGIGRLFRGAIQLALVAEHSFRAAQQLLALLTPDGSTLHSGHCKTPDYGLQARGGSQLPTSKTPNLQLTWHFSLPTSRY